MRKVLTIMALFAITLLSLSLVSAINDDNLAFRSVEVNGDDIGVIAGALELLSVEEGQTLDIKIGLTAAAPVAGAPVRTGANDIEVDAKISGYDKVSNDEDISDSTNLFDLNAGTTKYVTLHVTVPRDVKKENYTLRLRVLSQNDAPLELNIPLSFEAPRHGVDIADVSFSPSLNVEAGRSLLVNVLLENFGDRNQKNVKVTVAIPSLGVSATEYTDKLDADNSDVNYEDVPEMFLSIPATTATGDYDGIVTAQFDHLKRKVSKPFTVHVVANTQAKQPAQSEALVVAVGPETQTMAVSQTAAYAVSLINAGTTSKAYSVEVATGSWATSKVSESLVVLEPGKNKVVYVELTAATDATPGAHVASLVVKSGSDVLQTISLNANVVAPSTPAKSNVTNLRNGLEIALIVLVVLLVIIGLVIGFSRLKKDDEEDKTYY